MQMKYKELKNPCKKLIEEGKCTGCNKLELNNFEADKNCKYAKEILGGKKSEI